MNLLLQQLYIIRGQIDLLIGMQEGLPPPSDECPHPEDKRVDATNMGQEPHFYCRQCGRDIPGQA